MMMLLLVVVVGLWGIFRSGSWGGINPLKKRPKSPFCPIGGARRWWGSWGCRSVGFSDHISQAKKPPEGGSLVGRITIRRAGRLHPGLSVRAFRQCALQQPPALRGLRAGLGW